MGIFDTLGKRSAPTGQQRASYDAMMQDVGQIKSDPGSYLKDKGFSIPQGMTDAKQITQYLLKTGQVGSPRLQQVMQFLGISR